MSLQKNIFLQERKSAYVRFKLPVELLNRPVAEKLVLELSKIPGVTQARVNIARKRLVIRYDESVCPFIRLARHLFSIVSKPVIQDTINPATTRMQVTGAENSDLVPAMSGHHPLTRFSHWIKAKAQEVRETIEAASIVIRAVLKKPSAFFRNPEKALLEFCNDVLMLFLIKLHWHRITQHWILQPWRYRYEWIAVFYLVFLLVRSRTTTQIDHKQPSA